MTIMYVLFKVGYETSVRILMAEGNEENNL